MLMSKMKFFVLLRMTTRAATKVINGCLRLITVHENKALEARHFL